MRQVPVVEVHISNIFAREEYRHHSLTASACSGCITGFGLKGYEIALQSLINGLVVE
jgi:3-dehydroquinate dehydratase-2